MMRIILMLLFSVFITSCRDQVNLAPVASSAYLQLYAGRGEQREHAARDVYVVKPHDTLYSIAFRYDKDFLKLAELNHIQSPYPLKAGQILYLQMPTRPQAQRRVVSNSRIENPPYNPPPAPLYKGGSRISFKNGGAGSSFAKGSTAHSSNLQKPVIKQSSRWVWPIQGKIVKGYAPNQSRKGIDLAGRRGDQIKASAPGVVAYAGNGLPGYGNLIIIKHDNNLLTAYSHNEKNWVKEGQRVHAGQAIAKIGMIDRKFYGLHYEIRQSGYPVNPMRYLK